MDAAGLGVGQMIAGGSSLPQSRKRDSPLREGAFWDYGSAQYCGSGDGLRVPVVFGRRIAAPTAWRRTGFERWFMRDVYLHSSYHKSSGNATENRGWIGANSEN